MRLRKKQNKVKRTILKIFLKAKPSLEEKDIDALGSRNFSINLH